MTEDELRAIAGDLVTIGSHTDSHVSMPGLPEAAARRELRISRGKLSRMIGRDVNLFCFPFGAADPESVRLCREEGYIRAFRLAFRDFSGLMNLRLAGFGSIPAIGRSSFSSR